MAVLKSSDEDLVKRVLSAMGIPTHHHFQHMRQDFCQKARIPREEQWHALNSYRMIARSMRLL